MQWIISCNYWSISKVYSTVLDGVLILGRNGGDGFISFVLGDRAKLFTCFFAHWNHWSL